MDEQPAPRVLDPVKNDAVELDRLLVMVEDALEQHDSGWEAAPEQLPAWAQRLDALSRRVRADVPGTAVRGLSSVANSLDEFTDDETRAHWRDGLLPEAEERCIRYGDNLCYYLHHECGWYLNDPRRIKRLTGVAERALDQAMREPGRRHIHAAELHALYARVRSDAEPLAAFGLGEWSEDPLSHFDPALDAYLEGEYDSIAVLGCAEFSAKSAACAVFAYIEGECGLHLNSRPHFIALLSAAEDALERVAPKSRVPFLVDLYHSLRRNLDAAVEGGMDFPGSIARALDGIDDQVVSTAIDLTRYLRRCQSRPAGDGGI